MTEIDFFVHNQDGKRNIVLATATSMAVILHLAIIFSVNFGQTNLANSGSVHKSVVINLVSLQNSSLDMQVDGRLPEAETQKEALLQTVNEKIVDTNVDLSPARKVAGHAMPDKEKRGKKKQKIPGSTNSKRSANSGKSKQVLAMSEAVQSANTKNYAGQDAAPVPLEATWNRRPAYPEIARQRGQEGMIILLARIDKNGILTGLDVSRSSGYPMLDEAAINAVRKWRFKPATMAGAAVEGTVAIPVDFRLK